MFDAALRQYIDPPLNVLGAKWRQLVFQQML